MHRGWRIIPSLSRTSFHPSKRATESYGPARSGCDVAGGRTDRTSRPCASGRSAGGNIRNGTSSKTVTTEIGDVEISVPRDRDGTFDPQTVPKHQRRLEGFNASVVSLYAKGMTVREIRNISKTCMKPRSHRTRSRRSPTRSSTNSPIGNSDRWNRSIRSC
ncbi:MAG: hypothetical protein CL424_07060 [Acidimicrobiaceae bacterium]|nr:hypothetical protein [Acidimicrobiaceae bacterium]